MRCRAWHYIIFRRRREARSLLAPFSMPDSPCCSRPTRPSTKRISYIRSPPSSLASLSWNGTRVGPTAAVERGYRGSPQACSLSLQGWGADWSSTLRAAFSPAHPLADIFHPPSHPSEAVRCARTENIRLQPLLCSGSKGSARVSIHPFPSPRLPLPTTTPLASLHLAKVRT